MGIHDRDYYRDDSNRWGTAREHRGVILLIAVTIALTVVNFVATEQPQPQQQQQQPAENEAQNGWRGEPNFVLEEALRFEYGKIVPEGQVWRFFTSFLLVERSNWLLGLLFGMLLLYFFGGEMEILYGTGRFVTFYVVAGVLANVIKFLLALIPIGATVATYGNAAPMFATMVLFAFHYPHRPIRIWFLIPIPVWILVSIYLALNMLGVLGMLANRQMDALPHGLESLVGAAVGFAYYRTRGRLFAFLDVFGRLFRQRERSRRSPANLRVYDDNAPRPSTRTSSPPPAASPEPVPQPAGGAVDEHLEAKLDAVLAKVARHGKGSLTAEENDILMRASEVFKKKRR